MQKTFEKVQLCNTTIPLTVLSQNIRSLNLSEPGLVTLREKLTFITAKRLDIYFLSEVKCHSHENLDSIENHIATCKNGPYSLLLNSSRKQGGTAILIAKRLNITPIEIVRDEDENFILFNCNLGNLSVTFGAVYAPSMLEVDYLQNYTTRCRGWIANAPGWEEIGMQAIPLCPPT